MNRNHTPSRLSTAGGTIADGTIDTTLSVVVPVYNSEQSLPLLIERLEPVLREHTSAFEVILVNDGSRDRSWEVIETLVQRYDWVRGVNMMRNYGQHNAILCGTRAARHATTVTMDDDLQHPPEEIPRLLEHLRQGCDVVYGIPRALPHSMLRNLMSKLTKRAMSSAMGIGSIRDISAFRAFRTDLRRAFENYQSPSLLFDVLLSWGTTRFGAVKVEHEPRRIGTSNYTFIKLFNQALLILTGFSTAPLRLASFIGFGFTVVGIGVLLYAVIKYFVSSTLPGFPFLASIIALFSGAQLFSLGIIGEYLARMFSRSIERPTYVVAETVGQQPDTVEAALYERS
jgi:undecaprenyl-phosphate 4-deoxy-4-formamido-L-arabinose transferase